MFFYHPDHLGSSSYITDANGEVSQHLEYFAFGETFVEEHSNKDATPYLYNAKELDEETGLYYYGARYYDPVSSVWVSVDPLVLYDPVKEVEAYLDGQHNGGVFNSGNLASYSYTYGNPIIYVDPNGKQNFSSAIIGEIEADTRGNTIIRGISTTVLSWSSVRLGRDCIEVHNSIVQNVLFPYEKVKLGSQVIGKNSTHRALSKALLATGLKTFKFLDSKGNTAPYNNTADRMKSSIGNYLAEKYDGNGVAVYGVSINDGYHTMTLTYGMNEGGELEYNLFDQGPGTNFLDGQSTFKCAEKLDEKLNKYVRGLQGKTTNGQPSNGRNQFGANVQIFKIKNDKNE